MTKSRLIDPEDPRRVWLITIDKDGRVVKLEEQKRRSNEKFDSK